MQEAHRKRRQEDLAKVQQLASEYHGVVSITSTMGNPISKIALKLKVPTAASSNYPNEVCGESSIEIHLSSRYPFEAPVVKVTSKVWNPNIYTSGTVCLGTKWLPTQGLDLLVERVMQLLAYDPLIINTSSPANQEAARWYLQAKTRHPSRFPTTSLDALKKEISNPSIGWKDLGSEKSADRVITCYGCKVKLRVPAGKRLRVSCPKCCTTFEVGP
jgi:ubiquitin-protein ligase